MVNIIQPNVVHEMKIKDFETEVMQNPGAIHYWCNVFLPKDHPFYAKKHDEINRIFISEKDEDHLNYLLTDSYFIYGDYWWCISFNTDKKDGTVPTLQDAINELIKLVDLLV
jgi:hypothetical protein